MFKREYRALKSPHNRHRQTKPIFSTFLFSKSSALNGAGSILSIGGNYYDFNYSKSEQEADRRAFAKDWEAVYHDLNSSFERLTDK